MSLLLDSRITDDSVLTPCDSIQAQLSHLLDQLSSAEVSTQLDARALLSHDEDAHISSTSNLQLTESAAIRLVDSISALQQQRTDLISSLMTPTLHLTSIKCKMACVEVDIDSNERSTATLADQMSVLAQAERELQTVMSQFDHDASVFQHDRVQRRFADINNTFEAGKQQIGRERERREAGYQAFVGDHERTMREFQETTRNALSNLAFASTHSVSSSRFLIWGKTTIGTYIMSAMY